MIRTGQRVPQIRVPALIDGTLTYFDWNLYAGRWLALCSVPALGLIDTIFLEHQCDVFAQSDTTLIAMCPEEGPFQHTGITHLGPLRLPILADPLRRLHRAYGLPTQRRLGRCHTFLIDPERVLRVQILHDLNGRGINAVLELLTGAQGRDLPTFEPGQVMVAQTVSRLL